MRPFRFGVNVRSAGSYGELVDKARKVEALGYAVLLVPITSPTFSRRCPP